MSWESMLFNIISISATLVAWIATYAVHSTILLISGTLDGRTSVRNAKAVLLGLPNGIHLVVKGASHGDDLFLSTPDIHRTIMAFLRGGQSEGFAH